MVREGGGGEPGGVIVWDRVFDPVPHDPFSTHLFLLHHQLAVFHFYLADVVGKLEPVALLG